MDTEKATDSSPGMDLFHDRSADKTTEVDPKTNPPTDSTDSTDSTDDDSDTDCDANTNTNTNANQNQNTSTEESNTDSTSESKTPRDPLRRRENILHISPEWSRFWGDYLRYFGRFTTLGQDGSTFAQQLQQDTRLLNSLGRWDSAVDRGPRPASALTASASFHPSLPHSFSPSSHVPRSGLDDFYFPVRYHVSEMTALLLRVYPFYWSYFMQRKEFFGKHTLFYAHLRANIRHQLRMPLDEPVAKAMEWSVDPVEFARLALHYMRVRTVVLRQKLFWWRGRCPRTLPKAFAEKIHLDLAEGKKIEFLNVGDLHGSAGVVCNLILRLREANILSDDWKLLTDDVFIVFTGDFADRGYFGLEVWTMILYLLIRNPSQVHVVKANHEYGAEAEFRRYEVPAKLHLDVSDYPRLFHRIAETFPDFLFITARELDTTKCWIYSHGAVEYGYNPKGFLNSADTRFQNIPIYDRTWLYEYLNSTNPELLEKLKACRDFDAIQPQLNPVEDGAPTGSGPTWNYHHNGPMVSVGTYGHGLLINQTMLRTILEGWSASDRRHWERHGEEYAAWIVHRMRVVLQSVRASEKCEAPPKVVYRVCIGGHEHTNIKDVHFLTQAQKQNGVGFLWDWNAPHNPAPFVAPTMMRHQEGQRHLLIQTGLLIPPITEGKVSANSNMPTHTTEPIGISPPPPLEHNLPSKASAELENEHSINSTDHEGYKEAPNVKRNSAQKLDSNEIRYMVYKFFNMLDIVYYKLHTVSNGKLALEKKSGLVSDTIRAEVIQDLAGLYTQRSEFQRLYEANLTRQDPNLF